MMNLKKFFGKLRTKFLTLLTIITTVVMNVKTIYAEPSESSITSGVNGMVDFVFILIGLIFGIAAIFFGINAGMAWSETRNDGGNAQASGKLMSNLITSLVLAGITVLIFTVLKNNVKTMLGL